MMEARATDVVRDGTFDGADGREPFAHQQLAAPCKSRRHPGRVRFKFVGSCAAPGLRGSLCPASHALASLANPLATGSLPHCPHPSHGTLHCTTLHSLGSHGARNPGFPATRPPGVLGLGGGSTNPGVLHGAAQSRLCALATGQGRGETATFPRLLPAKARCNFMVLTLSRPCGVQLLHQQVGDRALCPPWRFKVAQVRSPSRAGHNNA